jgi:hypothetical protein
MRSRLLATCWFISATRLCPQLSALLISVRVRVRCSRNSGPVRKTDPITYPTLRDAALERPLPQLVDKFDDVNHHLQQALDDAVDEASILNP